MSYDINLGRLPDPTTTPVGPGFVSQQLIDNTPGMVHPLNSGSTVSVKYPGGNYWTIDVAYPELAPSQALVMQAFLYSIQGGFDNFYVALADKYNPQTGAWDVSLAGMGNLALGVNSRTLVISNWDTMSSTGNDFSVGDLLKLTNSKKVYFIVGRTYTAGVFPTEGTLTLTLNCDILNSSILNTTQIQPNEVRIRVRVSSDIPPLMLNNNGLYNPFNLSMRENIL